MSSASHRAETQRKHLFVLLKLFVPQIKVCHSHHPYHPRSSHQDSFPKYQFFFFRSNLFIIFQGREGPFVPRKDMNFPGGSICSSNRHEFSRRVYMFFEQTQIFQEGLSKRHAFPRRFFLFVEHTYIYHRTDTNFPRNPYLHLKHIQIFQESLFSYRTDTHFPGSPI